MDLVELQIQGPPFSIDIFELKMVQIVFWNLRKIFEIQFKNTTNLVLLSFKVPSERFFHKNFKTDLTF